MGAICFLYSPAWIFFLFPKRLLCHCCKCNSLSSCAKVSRTWMSILLRPMAFLSLGFFKTLNPKFCWMEDNISVLLNNSPSISDVLIASKTKSSITIAKLKSWGSAANLPFNSPALSIIAPIFDSILVVVNLNWGQFSRCQLYMMSRLIFYSAQIY